MTETYEIDVFECRGSPYDVGYGLAKGYRRTRGEDAKRPQGDLRIADFDVEDARRTLADYAPGIWDELHGIADGLEMPFEEAVAAFSNGRLAYPRRGCSAVMTGGLYGRNYDFSRQRYDRALVAVQADGAHASIGFADRYTGRLDGMNERGLCAGLHYVNEEAWKPGLACILVVRIVLDQCASTEDAIALLRRLPHGLGFNYSLIDRDGDAAVVEASPSGIAVRRGAWLACTNHFQSAELQAANRDDSRHSVRRLPPLEDWARTGPDAAALFRAFNDATSPAFHYGPDFGTLHTIVCEPALGRMTIGIGPDAVLRRIDLPGWARGEALGFDKIEGKMSLADEKTFAGRDLGRARFKDVNLASARFDDINFADAEITANCNFKGMRIAGILVEDLLAAYRRARPNGIAAAKARMGASSCTDFQEQARE